MPHHRTYRRLLQAVVSAAEVNRLVGKPSKACLGWATVNTMNW